MKSQTSEWVEKAEEDYRSTIRLLRVRKEPTYNTVCFHAQQCAEKYLKAVLIEEDLEFERTHDLATLLPKLIDVDKAWELSHPFLKALSDYSVKFRYPGKNADKAMAQDSLNACKRVREHARLNLGLRSGRESKKPAKNRQQRVSPKRKRR